MIVFTIILNVLCNAGLSVISWMIVFIPFIMMTILTSLLLFVFGLSPSSGKLDYKVEYPGDKKINGNSVYITHGDEYIENSAKSSELENSAYTTDNTTNQTESKSSNKDKK